MWEKQTHYQTSLSRTVFQLLGQLRKRTNFLACCMGSLSDGSVQVLLCNTSSGKYTYGICTTIYFFNMFFFRIVFCKSIFHQYSSTYFHQKLFSKSVSQVIIYVHVAFCLSMLYCTMWLLPLRCCVRIAHNCTMCLLPLYAVLHDVASASRCCIIDAERALCDM